MKEFHSYTVDEQQRFLKELLHALRAVTTNAYLLNEQSKGKPKIESIRLLECIFAPYLDFEDHRSVLNLLIEALIANVKNYLIFNLLQQILE